MTGNRKRAYITMRHLLHLNYESWSGLKHLAGLFYESWSKLTR